MISSNGGECISININVNDNLYSFGILCYFQKWEGVMREKSVRNNVSNVKENLYKRMYCWYLMPDKLSKMYMGMSSKCWKCNLYLLLLLVINIKYQQILEQNMCLTQTYRKQKQKTE